MAETGNPLPIADIVERKLTAFVMTYCDNYAKEAEEYAQENRPWQDRTGMARKLIKGIVLDGGEAGFDLYHIKTETVKDAEGKVQKDTDGKAVKKVTKKRIGTVAITDSEGRIGVALAHRVDYGKHLEEANSGKYAILKPTLEHFRSRFTEDARKYFGSKK